MKNNIYIREMKKTDLPAVKQIIDDNQMFPSDYLDEMSSGFFSHDAEEHWFVAANSLDEVVAITYCAPESMTEGTWNLLLIAVLKKYQGLGIGGQLIQHVEDQLKRHEVRVLLVETSGTAEYELTRRFYPKCGYTQVAVIPEYYDQGDDKVVFWKPLG